MLRLVLIIMISLPIALISATILQVYKHDLISQTTDRTMQTLRAVTYSEEQEINKTVNFTALIGMDRDVLGTATKVRQGDEGSRHDYQDELAKILDNYGASMSGHLQSVTFFYKQGGTYSYLKDLQKDPDSLRHTQWYRTVLSDQDHVHFIGNQTDVLYGDTDETRIAAAIAPSYMQMMHNVEMIYIVFSKDAFEKILWQDLYRGAFSFRIANKDGQVLATSYNAKSISTVDPKLRDRISLSKEGHFEQQLNGTSTLVAYSTVGTADWKVIYQIPFAELTVRYDQIFRYVLWGTMGVVVLISVISLLLVYGITKPLHLLVLKMSRVMDGKLNTKIEASGFEETVILGRTFNHMMEQILHLIKQKEDQEREKSKAEFAALQSQINPHFLINTLNSIKLMAVISKVDNIRNMTQSLMRLVSSSFNRGGSETKLGEEVENLKHYLYIMQTRYGNAVEVEWDVEEAANALYILKLLLQPILENCILHGLAAQNVIGKISIRIRIQEGVLRIEIADNGVGMTKEGLERILTGDRNGAFSGMGIANVHRRIQLHYGEEYGIRMEQNEPSGLSVMLAIPAIYHIVEDGTDELNGPAQS
ncbi:HAMP domain-containing protein [Paenibacillus rhizovicinus]|uniref:histidine kinase n=1 Tax=Paenibacillus rhizovicinus TaxID=2704463 RepID=A0A6C0P499_9BACL|nr:sensor histidine kinase [Paenibacillus rhizovicinus]QHW33161.1 HAMP domain-containing protein [Paenibacillus rhizovicinus]